MMTCEVCQLSAYQAEICKNADCPYRIPEWQPTHRDAHGKYYRVLGVTIEGMVLYDDGDCNLFGVDRAEFNLLPFKES